MSLTYTLRGLIYTGKLRKFIALIYTGKLRKIKGRNLRTKRYEEEDKEKINSTAIFYFYLVNYYHSY